MLSLIINSRTYFDIYKSFRNLCELSNDVVIIVVPFLQEQHTTSDFKDYWRFTPQTIKKLFEKNNFKLAYINANDQNNCQFMFLQLDVKRILKI